MRIIVHHAIIIYTCQLAVCIELSIHTQHWGQYIISILSRLTYIHTVGAGDKSTPGSNPTTKRTAQMILSCVYQYKCLAKLSIHAEKPARGQLFDSVTIAIFMLGQHASSIHQGRKVNRPGINQKLQKKWLAIARQIKCIEGFQSKKVSRLTGFEVKSSERKDSLRFFRTFFSSGFPGI